MATVIAVIIVIICAAGLACIGVCACIGGTKGRHRKDSGEWGE